MGHRKWPFSFLLVLAFHLINCSDHFKNGEELGTPYKIRCHKKSSDRVECRGGFRRGRSPLPPRDSTNCRPKGSPLCTILRYPFLAVFSKFCLRRRISDQNRVFQGPCSALGEVEKSIWSVELVILANFRLSVFSVHFILT